MVLRLRAQCPTQSKSESFRAIHREDEAIRPGEHLKKDEAISQSGYSKKILSNYVHLNMSSDNICETLGATNEEQCFTRAHHATSTLQL